VAIDIYGSPRFDEGFLHRFECCRARGSGQSRQYLFSQNLQTLDVIQLEPIDHDLLNAGRFVRANLLNDPFGYAIDHMPK